MSLLLFNHLLKKDNLPIPEEDLTLWYDAADISTITETLGNVVQWNDKSKNKNHAVQNNAARQPVTGTTKLNDLNTVNFNVGKYMLTQQPVTTDDNITVFIVFDAMSDSPINPRNADFFRDQPEAGAVTYINSSNNDKYGMFNGIILSSDFIANNDTALLTSIFNNVNSKLRRNGEEILSGNTGTLSNTNILQLADEWTDGEIAEFIFYNRILTLDEIEQVESYLAIKWGLDKLPYLNDLGLWLDSADINTITQVAGSVSQIDDKSGNNNHAVKNIASKQPTFGTDSTGNFLQFTKSSSSAFVPAENFLTFTGPVNGKTVIWVGDWEGRPYSMVLGSDEVNGSYIFVGGPGPAISIDGILNDTGSWYLDGIFQGSGANIGGPSSTTLGNNARLHSVVYDTNSPLTDFTRLCSYNHPFATDPNASGYSGKIREIFVYNEYLTDAQRKQTENYLLNKWFGNTLVSNRVLQNGTDTRITQNGDRRILNG